jgi:hypothetical protein
VKPLVALAAVVLALVVTGCAGSKNAQTCCIPFPPGCIVPDTSISAKALKLYQKVLLGYTFPRTCSEEELNKKLTWAPPWDSPDAEPATANPHG